jgi:hypothetical protein
MSERDYIVATNLARVRVMQALLRDLLPCEEVHDARKRDVGEVLGRWEEYLAEAVKKGDG